MFRQEENLLPFYERNTTLSATLVLSKLNRTKRLLWKASTPRLINIKYVNPCTCIFCAFRLNSLTPDNWIERLFARKSSWERKLLQTVSKLFSQTIFPMVSVIVKWLLNNFRHGHYRELLFIENCVRKRFTYSDDKFGPVFYFSDFIFQNINVLSFSGLGLLMAAVDYEDVLAISRHKIQNFRKKEW